MDRNTALSALIDLRQILIEEGKPKIAEALDIAKTVDLIEYPIRGWSFVYTQPLMDGDRKEHTARFYNVKKGDRE